MRYQYYGGNCDIYIFHSFSFSFSFFGLFADYMIYIRVRDICIYTGVYVFDRGLYVYYRKFSCCCVCLILLMMSVCVTYFLCLVFMELLVDFRNFIGFFFFSSLL